MTVKEIFELRKQGRVEEAYEAIRPMYAIHKGKYTTLAMFWTASDVFKLRVEQKRLPEAEKIFKALLRVYPNIDDKDQKGHQAILRHAIVLAEASTSFRILDFFSHFGVECLTEDDWKTEKSSAGFLLPSTAMRILTRMFHEIHDNPSVDDALLAMPLLEAAVKRSPNNRHCQRYMATVYRIMGEKEKAVDIYQKLLKSSHDSWLYAELADVTDNPGTKAALLCQAIMNQRQEKFRTKYRFLLAQLLVGRDDARAAYEIHKCISVRQVLGYGSSERMKDLYVKLSGVHPVAEEDQLDFYRRMVCKFGQ